MPLSSNEIEAANRAEATALLIRSGFRVYRPEADCEGEDLVVRTPEGELRSVQLKSRPMVDEAKYGGDKSIWMLFPDTSVPKNLARAWYLVPHARITAWAKDHHGHTQTWVDGQKWSYKHISVKFRAFLDQYRVGPANGT